MSMRPPGGPPVGSPDWPPPAGSDRAPPSPRPDQMVPGTTADRLPPGPVLSQEWHRLHPLSPVVRAGRGVLAIVVFLLFSLLGGKGQSSDELVRLAVIVVVLVIGIVSWYVTRWRVEGGVLRIDSGLLRRTSQRLPLSQVQAIDIVRPGLARVLGLSELRLRMAGSTQRAAGRLSYLNVTHAEELRARLLAAAHGLDEAEPPPPEQQLLTVATGRLVVSLLISGPGLILELLIVALVVLAAVQPSAVVGALSGSLAGLVALVGPFWARFNGQYHQTVAAAPDGLRVRAGLVETSAETIPRGRVQALRLVEPLVWRRLGWCRLEADVAGRATSGHQNRAARKAGRVLLPVGTRAEAQMLVDRVMPGVPITADPAPRRARWKSPLRYRQLSWGVTDDFGLTTSGRFRHVADWMPLSKVQSIRRVEGPLQRRLRLASIHLDTAARSVHAVIRDRDRVEVDRLMVELPERCRRSREADGRPRVDPQP